MSKSTNERQAELKVRREAEGKVKRPYWATVNEHDEIKALLNNKAIKMNKCEPVEMRKNLEVVSQLKMAGIDFVAVPVKSKAHKKELIEQVNDAFIELIQGCE